MIPAQVLAVGHPVPVKVDALNCLFAAGAAQIANRPDLYCCVSPRGHTATTVTASISAVSARRSRGSLARMRARWPNPMAVAATMASTVSALR